MDQEREERTKVRFNSANKLPQGESKSTSLSSSSSTGSLRQITDTKYPGDLLRHRRHSVKNKIKGKPGYKQFLTVEEEGEEQDKGDKEGGHRKLLPHFTVINDRREFLASPTSFRMMRCKSVGTLTKVDEEKKQEDGNKRLISKLYKLLDKDEFNMGRGIHLSSTEVLENYHHASSPIAEIREAEEPKQEMPTSIEKSPIGSELEKIIVDEIDDNKKKYREDREERQEPEIESIIEERNEDEHVDTQFRTVLTKLHEQKDFIKKMNNSQEVRVDVVDSESITLLTETIKEEQEGENQS